MTDEEIKKAEFIAEYLHKNYYDDCERMVNIPMVSALVKHSTVEKIPSLIDKLAIFNNIKKSYPLKEIVINA